MSEPLGTIVTDPRSELIALRVLKWKSEPETRSVSNKLSELYFPESIENKERHINETQLKGMV
jgi:hypothetical protein